ncbi:holo-ACP synthase [Sediminispirochaeta smaragdinae]|uniref:Holo-[acyl-carrier-protein] synthase n=1 Tax=Sediminispirochaeta smaragdinae (strain DSM 11293 / JCM 15392 / SEBR 4228) TaxID=573413 RepID=E1R611_SEDSS|nr:holo-ACP synthase [Sediminispirochaeta smaragdinae]ADK80776.1 holo-acyl-carrier-protein synthase [Sediminispirochaeta smaragdinae DSM 11293]
MIIGIGVDVVDTARLEHWVKNPKMLARFFHPAEVAAALDRGAAAVLSLAARFAAKEAFGKALGTGMRGLVLRDIEVINQHNGKPEIQLYGTALRAFRRSGGRFLHLSLTHEKKAAVAMVVIEGDSI